MGRVLAFGTSVALFCASIVAAWGPTSHYDFTCTALQLRPDECLSGKGHDFLSGTEMPDAFGFGALLSPLGPGSLPCAGWEYIALHSPVLAGFLYKNAANYTTPTFNATAYAIGFGMHVTADASGFFDHGYLGYGWGNGRTVPTVNNTANWLGLWPFMEAVDVYLWHTVFAKSGRKLPTNSDIPSAHPEVIKFLFEVIALANKQGAGFPTINATSIEYCAKEWQSMVASQSVRVMSTPLEVAAFNLVYNDRFGATNLTTAAAHLEMAKKCAIRTAAKWHEAIRVPSSTPVSAVEETIAFVEAAYAAGECTPAKDSNTNVEIQW